MRALLALDNCEQVISDTRDLVAFLRQTCDGLRFLATSREPFALVGERIVQIPPMSLPSEGGPVADTDAVLRFRDRAQAVRTDFTLNADNTDSVVELCRRLDGIPLAIELAAARSGSLGPKELLEDLHERFRLLVTESSGAPERHRTLWGTIDWSIQLLNDTERTVLRRVAIFVGSFDLPAMKAVCATQALSDMDVVDVLANLVSKSLIVPIEVRGQTRSDPESIGVFVRGMPESSHELDAVNLFTPGTTESSPSTPGPACVDPTNWIGRPGCRRSWTTSAPPSSGPSPPSASPWPPTWSSRSSWASPRSTPP